MTDETAFRAEVLAFLEATLPPKGAAVETGGTGVTRSVAFQRQLADAGLAGITWPVEYGGRGLPGRFQRIFDREAKAFQVPPRALEIGLGMCGPTLLVHASEEQKQALIPPLLRGEHIWCELFSEPGAGSDLSSVQTRARLDGDEFVLDGQKVWTSGAHEADYCMCYVRTDPEAPKHRGISVIIMDMRTPGITCRPLPELTDQHHADFNEVFFTDVVVPEENLLGELHGGWAVSQGSLRHERGMLWIMNVSKMERTLKALVRLAGRPDGRGGTLGDDARIAEAIGRLATDTAAMRCLGYRGFEKSTRGEMSPEHVVLKLFTSEAEQRACLFAQDALGVEGLDLDGPGPSRFTEWDLAHFEPSPTERSAMSSFYDGAWAVQYLRSFAGTIAGGTSEIQRNIVAERVLGLPRG